MASLKMNVVALRVGLYWIIELKQADFWVAACRKQPVKQLCRPGKVKCRRKINSSASS